jgi:hypothetical protein
MKKIVYATIALVICCFGVLLLLRNRAVLYAYHESGDLGEPAFIVLNPFRDRTPERISQQFLAQLGSAHCNDLVEPLRQEYAKFVCAEELKYPAQRFHIANRQDRADVTRLSFRVERSGLPDGVPSHAQMELRKSLGQWQITDFQPVY